MPLWVVLMWAAILARLAYLFPHKLHSCGLFPVWIFVWSSKNFFCQNPLPQNSPKAWNKKYILQKKWPRLVNFSPQSLIYLQHPRIGGRHLVPCLSPPIFGKTFPPPKKFFFTSPELTLKHFLLNVRAWWIALFDFGSGSGRVMVKSPGSRSSSGRVSGIVNQGSWRVYLT